MPVVLHSVARRENSPARAAAWAVHASRARLSGPWRNVSAGVRSPVAPDAQRRVSLVNQWFPVDACRFARAPCRPAARAPAANSNASRRGEGEWRCRVEYGRRVDEVVECARDAATAVCVRTFRRVIPTSPWLRQVPFLRALAPLWRTSRGYARRRRPKTTRREHRTYRNNDARRSKSVALSVLARGFRGRGVVELIRRRFGIRPRRLIDYDVRVRPSSRHCSVDAVRLSLHLPFRRYAYITRWATRS